MSKGGARPGAGRPKGSMDESTKLRRDAEKVVKDNIAKVAKKLLSALLSKALGESSLYVMYYTGKGKDRKKHVDRITDPDIIMKYLKDDLEKGDNDEYYFISTKTPDTKAIEALFNRVFGKPKESMDITTDGNPLPVPIMGGTSVLANNSIQQDSEAEE